MGLRRDQLVQDQSVVFRPTTGLGAVDKLDSQARQNLIQDSFCGVYLGAFADGGCRVGVL